MGLDMYLYRKTYVKNWRHMQPEQLHHIEIKRGEFIRQDIKPERIAYIIEEVAYWRKANQIHKWFVDNVQDGVDECQESSVEREKLGELVALCKKVIENAELVDGKIHNGTTIEKGVATENYEDGKVLAQPGVAAALLPTASGFFFGGTEYDEYYLEDLKDTVEQLEPLLDDTEGEYIYRASW